MLCNKDDDGFFESKGENLNFMSVDYLYTSGRTGSVSAKEILLYSPKTEGRLPI